MKRPRAPEPHRVEKAECRGSLRPRGVSYIVAFQVESRARRVDHRSNNNIAYLTDETGTEHNNDTQVQQEPNRIQPFGYKKDYVTPAGATETTMFVFELTPGVREPYLQVRGSLLMGDLLDGNQYSKTKVKLF